MELLLDPITINSRKALAGFKLIGVDYTVTKIDYFQAKQQSPEYVAINPNASVPALRDGDFTLWESNAILQYAADKLGNASAYPTELKTRADVNRWLLWESSAWFPSCYKYVAGILDARLAGSRYLCGDEPTIADVAVAAPMHMHAYFKLPLENHKNLVRWMTQDIEKNSWWIDTTVLEGFALPDAG